MGKYEIKRSAVFLDRDGTIIRQVELLHKVSEMKLLPRVADAIRRFNKLGYLVIMVTNQSVVARGIATREGVELLHEALSLRLRKKGAKIDAMDFCPHHPDATVKKYRMKCNCRKPGPGMILKAIRKFNIDSRKSFMIGDALIDAVAGKRAGLTTILVKTGPGHPRLDEKYKVKPDFVAGNLLEAVSILEKATGRKK